jgi:TRAP-type C4-dicarboxylate transport system permease small subunit
MRLIRKLDHVLARLERLLIVGLFTALISLITFNIIGRNFLNVSSQRLLEVIPALVLWLSLLGASLALRHRRHIKLEVLLRYLDPRIGRIARTVAAAAGALLMAVLLAASLTFVKNEIDIFGRWGWISAVFPLFFVMAALRFTLNALAPNGGPPPPGLEREPPQGAAPSAGAS